MQGLMKVDQALRVSVGSGATVETTYTPSAAERFKWITAFTLKYDQSVRFVVRRVGDGLVLFDGESKQMQSPRFPVAIPYERGTTYSVSVTELAGGGTITAVLMWELCTHPPNII